MFENAGAVALYALLIWVVVAVFCLIVLWAVIRSAVLSALRKYRSEVQPPTGV